VVVDFSGQEHPEVLDRRAHADIVEIDDPYAFVRPMDQISLMAVAVDKEHFHVIEQRVGFFDEHFSRIVKGFSEVGEDEFGLMEQVKVVFCRYSGSPCNTE